MELVDPARSYFETAPEIRLPFRVTRTATAARPPLAADPDVASEVAVTVEYAWCLVDQQCLFGEARVSLPAPGED